MTPERPADTPAPARLPWVSSVGDAWKLVWRNQRATILPALIVQTAAGFLTWLLFAVAYLVFVPDEQTILIPLNGFEELDRGAQLVLLVMSGIQGLFLQVARSATVPTIAGIANGTPVPLAQAFDAVFTRMGTVVSLGVILWILGILFVTVWFTLLAGYLGLRLALSLDICMIEKRSARDSMAASWRLTGGSLLRLSVGFVTLAASLVPLLLVALLPGGIVGGGRDVQVVTLAIAMWIIWTLSCPAVTIATAFTTISYLKLKGATSG